MLPITRRTTSFSPTKPYRTVRPVTSKIIFLSVEGSETEEEYFERISELFSEVKTKIQFISVMEEITHTVKKYRTPEQKKMLTMSRPKQLVEKIDAFKIEKEYMYEFSKHPEDEFWIVTDVDANWEAHMCEEWNEAINMCHQKQYQYAISNPFFEIWLLLHHDEASEEDKAFAVTDIHSYEKTSHFRERLRSLGAPLHKQKHIKKSDYMIENVMNAINRAETLHIDKSELIPKYFATTVYLLLNKIIEMLPEEDNI